MLLQHKKMPRMRGHRVNYVKDVVSCWNEVKSRVNKLMVDQKKLSTLSAIATASFLPPEHEPEHETNKQVINFKPKWRGKCPM